MTIPTPTIFAARPAAVPTVVDTRCGEGKSNSSACCTRKAGHSGVHISHKRNEVWA